LIKAYGLNDMYGTDELEATGRAVFEAHERGHDLGDWRPIHERVRVAACRLCGRLVWIVCSTSEEIWRVGDNAFNADCGREFGTNEEVN
jgi:hypothetical protein